MNVVHVAKILIEADDVGDKTAAARYGISQAKLRSHRKDLDSDDLLAREYQELRLKSDLEWARCRSDFLKSTIAHLKVMCLNAFPEQINDVSRAIERIGNLAIASEALTIDDHSADIDPSQEAPGPTSAGRLQRVK